MKRIEVSLNLGVVAPLLDFMRPVLETLDHETAFPPGMEGIDHELESVWRNGLIHTQAEDCRSLMQLFDGEFFDSGRIALSEENADPILRAASAIRLKIRETALSEMNDALIESGEAKFESLSELERQGFATYLFLATLQEIIIRHLGGLEPRDEG